MTTAHTSGGLPGQLSHSLVSQRARSIDASGIRKVFDLAAKMKDPINLSIGQPDFPVPQSMKDAAKAAIDADRNAYTVTQGIPELIDACWKHLAKDVGWDGPGDHRSLIITSGTSGSLVLAAMALLDPGDEIVIPDPYFVMYAQLGKMTGGTVVCCDTYPDFRMTAERVERCITPRTKAVLACSPSNPCGTVLSGAEQRDLVDLCARKGVLLISDEIYDEFCFSDAREDGRCPSPARYSDQCLLIRGFGKTYGCTGWRMGYVAGPRAIVQEIAKFQQYTYVCAPSMAQWGVLPSFGVDLAPMVAEYERRRQMVVDAFAGVTELARPSGAFYAFVKVPERLGLTGHQFVERAIDRRVLVIPGGVFSRRDTHFRLSFATKPSVLAEGLGILRDLMVNG
jgi:aspartate/methionine/tyrosine aminotransferase